MSRSIDRVKAALIRAGIDSEINELPRSTRTAAEAAAAVGCRVGQIAKSLVFRTASDGFVLVIASGSNRVNEGLLASLIGQPIQRASPDFVRQVSGFAIGGVPPVGHERTPDHVLVDVDLTYFSEIWAAAGTPNAVVRLSPSQLIQLSEGQVADIKESSS